MVDYIWFDLGYTLVHLNREEVYREVLQQSGIEKTTEEIALAYHLTDKYFMREHPGLLGKKRENYHIVYQGKLHQFLRLEKEQTERLIKNKFMPRNEVRWNAFAKTIETLKELKSQGVGVGLISNWNDTARNVLKENHILPLLDHVVISSELGIEKPDERIFQHALEQNGVAPEKSLYIGDNYYDDVIGSKKVGMDSILINPFDRVGIEELDQQIFVISNIENLIPALDTRFAVSRG